MFFIGFFTGGMGRDENLGFKKLVDNGLGAKMTIKAT